MKIKRGPLDALFSKLIRIKAGWICERCGKNYENRPQGLHTAHMNSRRHISLRWEEDNAAAICFLDHQFLDSHPIEKIAFFKARVGERRFGEMYLRSKVPCRVDKSAVLLRLRARLKELAG